MAIKEFEFMHGGVITRLLRKDIPLQLTLVETSSNDRLDPLILEIMLPKILVL